MVTEAQATHWWLPVGRGGIGWMIEEVLEGEEAAWTVEINGRSRKQRHWEVWQTPCETLWLLEASCGFGGY